MNQQWTGVMCVMHDVDYFPITGYPGMFFSSSTTAIYQQFIPIEQAVSDSAEEKLPKMI